jgi:hypothetical protein
VADFWGSARRAKWAAELLAATRHELATARAVFDARIAFEQARAQYRDDMDRNSKRIDLCKSAPIGLRERRDLNAEALASVAAEGARVVDTYMELVDIQARYAEACATYTNALAADARAKADTTWIRSMK